MRAGSRVRARIQPAPANREPLRGGIRELREGASARREFALLPVPGSLFPALPPLPEPVRWPAAARKAMSNRTARSGFSFRESRKRPVRADGRRQKERRRLHLGLRRLEE